jgi:hypothetical protein
MRRNLSVMTGPLNQMAASVTPKVALGQTMTEISRGALDATRAPTAEATVPAATPYAARDTALPGAMRSAIKPTHSNS